MPAYDYQCDKCGTFEVRQKMDDAPLTACPQCGDSGVRRLISKGIQVVVRGGGAAGSSSGCPGGNCGLDAALPPSPCAGGACSFGEN